MEDLDYYDELGNYLGNASREEVHKKGLWHHTVHCWLYDKHGNIYFQIRKETKTFYTTASGHVLKGESIQEAFQREIKEEIGLDIQTEDAILVEVVPWQMDKIKKDGTIWKDRAKAHVYIDEFHGSFKEFNFDLKEVLGVVKMNAKETLELFKNERSQIKGVEITSKKGINRERIIPIKIDNFLVNAHETALGKYGKILEKIINQNIKKES